MQEDQQGLLGLLQCPHCEQHPESYITTNHLCGNGTITISCCSTMEEHFILDIYKPKKIDTLATALTLIKNRWNSRKFKKNG